ncbi:MAG: glycosyltransferase [Roseicyclus sp.]|uniref:glycosyltransferase n=1 Tax=Roseicyclus sp. TaxID=1914329 RepID=UPI003A8AF149
MLDVLSDAIRGNEHKVEILIHNNCSTDNTDGVIARWMSRQHTALCVSSLTHASNVGVSKNILSLLDASSAKYFMFLGDDDKLNAAKFSDLLLLLELKSPSAVVQGFWPGLPQKSPSGSLTFEEMTFFFYEFGNAWAGIVDRDAAVRALNVVGVREKVSQIVWPQTVLGFLAIYDLAPKRLAECVNFEIGGPLFSPLNRTNKAYWTRSLTDLLTAAAIVQRITGSLAVQKGFLRFTSSGLIRHIKGIFWNTILDDDRQSLMALRLLLISEFGIRGRIISLFLRMDDFPGLLKCVAALYLFFLRVKSGGARGRTLREAIVMRRSETLSGREPGRRYGDWF